MVEHTEGRKQRVDLVLGKHHLKQLQIILKKTDILMLEM